MSDSKAMWEEAARMRRLADGLMANAKEVVRVLYREIDTIEFNASLSEKAAWIQGGPK
jgi:hypothetical protein